MLPMALMDKQEPETSCRTPNSLDAPTVIVVAGTASDVGKTTLVCEFLQVLPGFEAIKLTRGHYRSCGKHPTECCVSLLLGHEPIVHSHPAMTRVARKDTGRYWAAGATAVHWVIATTDQVEAGIEGALGRVLAPGVIIEATSALRFLHPRFSVLVARDTEDKIKPSARRALNERRVDAVYFSDLEVPDLGPVGGVFDGLRVFTRGSKSALLEVIAKFGSGPGKRLDPDSSVNQPSTSV